jgi:hypothetical protein
MGVEVCERRRAVEEDEAVADDGAPALGDEADAVALAQQALKLRRDRRSLVKQRSSSVTRAETSEWPRAPRIATGTRRGTRARLFIDCRPV